MRTAILTILLCTAVHAADLLSLASPDGKVRFRLSDTFKYSVILSGNPVLEPSPLGITIDGAPLNAGAKPGKPRTIVAEKGCNAATLLVQSKQPFELQVRACNDGIAFRHLVPGNGKRTPDEATAFRLPGASTVWSHDLEGHYEANYTKQTASEIAAGAWLAPPVTFKLPGGAEYASITEADLSHYAGMALQSDGKSVLAARLGHAHPPSYPFRLRYKEDIERLAIPAAIEGPITTPWRVILIGRDLNALVNAALVARLNPPPDPALFRKGAATDWVKPGRAVWKYLDGGENNQETVREFSRLASQLGFEYQVVEGFWQKWPKDDLKAIIADSRKQSVGLWLWKHSKELRTPEARDEFFDLCREVGAAGVKIDFFDHEAKEVVELYEILLRDAAKRKLLVNFHGANKPTGESTTWPNELTREAVRGMESRKTERAFHDATLPFTRLLAGPADYTPMHFGERRNDTTWAHQIATAAVFTSGLLTYAAHPKSILENPAVDLIKAIPATWDETIALPPSEIGEVAIFARRKGQDWFLAVVNGKEARSLRIPLTFLGALPYSALMAGDKANAPAAVTMETATLRRTDAVTIGAAPGGGFLAHFTPGK
jgi:alpha-glucosidase